MRPTENSLRTFDEWYDSEEYHEYAKRWNEPSKEIMKHAWILYMNCAWVDKMFNENNQIEVLKHIIRKCKVLIADIDRFSETDEHCICTIHKDSKRELYRRLMLCIDEYCLD